MAANWKTIRVFISSTFRDMHAERDWLVKRVFPALRERLQQYRIHLVDIDLRWGITEEEAQHDQVLDLCLAQIDECRPFFVGILGERYGWVPQTFSDEAADKYGWVQHQTGKSVTELEILYGVLRDPKMHGHGMFFFRDPAFIADVPAFKRTDLEAEDAESAAKLAALKEAVREAALPYPPVENYPARYDGLRIDRQRARRELPDPAQRERLDAVAEAGLVGPESYARLDAPTRELVDRFGMVHLSGLEEFGRRVSEQLWQAIQREHQLPDVPPAAALAETDPLAEEADYHEQFMESRLGVYVGREEVQAQLTAFADGEATCPCLVTGRSGSGKSAVLARFVRSYAEANSEVQVVPHFVGASPGSTDLRQMLRRFCLELQRRFGPAEAVPQEVNALVSRFRQALDSVPGDRRVVIVIDALNQLDEAQSAHSMYWLPWQLPPQVKVVVSCIDDESSRHTPCADCDGTRRVPDTLEPILRALAPRPLERLEVHALTGDERLEIVRRVPSLSAKKLDPRQVGLLLANSATENPLFLLVALEELRGFGSYEQVADRIAAFPHGGEDPVAALFDQVIARLREEFDPDVVRTVLALLACSRHGMSEHEMWEMIEPKESEKGTGPIGAERGAGTSLRSEPVPYSGGESTSDLFPVLRQIRPYLQHRGELLDYFHRGLYKAVREYYVPDEMSTWAYHCDLADYFYGKLNPPGVGPWSGGLYRGLTELPFHQTRSGQWESLESTLTALPFLEAKTAAGLVFDLAGDFSAAVEALPQDRPQWRILKLLDEALRREIHFIARHAQDYPQGLIQCLWNTCWWYDCPEAERHYFTSDDPPYDTPPWESAEPKIHCLLQQWLDERVEQTGSFPWLRSHRPPEIPLGSALRAVLRGHESGVSSVAYSPDGRYIVSASDDGTLRVWDVRSGAEHAVLRGHERMVRSVSYRPDGARIASSDTGGTVRVWDARTGAEVVVLCGHNSGLHNLSYSPDGWRLAGGCRNDTVVWDVDTMNELLCMRGHQEKVNSVTYSPDGQHVATGSDDRTIRVWDSRSGEEVLCIRGHKDRVNTVAYSPDGRRIASGGGSWRRQDNCVHLWDAETGQEVACLAGHGMEVKCVTFSPDGKQIASGSLDMTIRIWDSETYVQLFLFPNNEEVHSLAFAPSTAELAVGCSSEKTVPPGVDFRLPTTLLVLSLTTKRNPFRRRDHTHTMSSICFSPDGGRIVTKTGIDIGIWDAEKGYEHFRIRDVPYFCGKEYDLTYSPDGRKIAIGSLDRTIHIWDTEIGAEQARFCGHEAHVLSVSYSPNGARIASGDSDGTVRVWDARTGAEAAVLCGHEKGVDCVAFSPDGSRIASGSYDETVRVWDAQTGAEVAVLRGHKEGVVCVAFSPNGTRIASGSWDKTVRLWDATNGAELAVLQGLEGRVESVSYSSDGRQIVGGSTDEVYVWDSEKGVCTEVIAGTSDVHAPIKGNAATWRALVRGQELVIQSAESCVTIARFPVAISCVTAHPSGKMWAGFINNLLYIMTLEWGPSS